MASIRGRVLELKDPTDHRLAPTPDELVILSVASATLRGLRVEVSRLCRGCANAIRVCGGEACAFRRAIPEFQSPAENCRPSPPHEVEAPGQPGGVPVNAIHTGAQGNAGVCFGW